MANNNSKNKTNTNNKKNNTKKVDNTKKVSETKKTNNTKKVEQVSETKKNSTTKKVEKVNNNKKGVNNNTKKEVKKVTPKKEEVKVEKISEEVVTAEVKKEKKSFKLTSKQRDFVLVILVAVVLVIAIVLTGAKKLDIELPIALEGEAGFTEITYSEYEEKLNTEAPFVVVIIRDGCSYCEMYEPVVESVANEYSLPIYYINLSNLTSDEQSALASSNSYLRSQQWGTPTTLFMYGNTVVDSIGGYVSEETLKEFAQENFVVE